MLELYRLLAYVLTSDRHGNNLTEPVWATSIRIAIPMNTKSCEAKTPVARMDEKEPWLYSSLRHTVVPIHTTPIAVTS